MAYKRPLTKSQSYIIAILWVLFAGAFFAFVRLNLMMIVVLFASAFIVFYPIYKSFKQQKGDSIRGRHFGFLLPMLLCCGSLSAQQSSDTKGLRFSGYIQAQTEWGGKDASLRVGALGKGDANQSGKNAWGIRRGRVKLDYKMSHSQAVLQLDLTEKGVKLKDAYFKLLSPWKALGKSSLTLGIFDRPFGYEISHSSSRRETPERAVVFPQLFPEERDLGLMLGLQANSSSFWSRLRLEFGLFAGNGINPEVDSRKDFIGHLTLADSIGRNFHWGLGASYYDGSVYNSLAKNYLIRRYYGIDTQVRLKSPLGETELRAEYLWGKQPSTREAFRSPNTDKLPQGYELLRPFAGGYVLLLHRLKSVPVSMVVKYDYLDRNTKIASRTANDYLEISSADLYGQAWGLGLLWDLNPNLRLQAYYEMPKNESAVGVEGYEKDRKDNNFTLRLQYKF